MKALATIAAAPFVIGVLYLLVYVGVDLVGSCYAEYGAAKLTAMIVGLILLWSGFLWGLHELTTEDESPRDPADLAGKGDDEDDEDD